MSYSTYNQPLTLDELRAYQAGTLSAAQQHRIERLLLENPLYADALEGLEAIQQAGSSLQRQTKSLHEALQERIHEAATPRRLMPLWVTSLAASVLLVLSVSFYLIYTTNPAATLAKKGTNAAGSRAVQPHYEPGTILLNINDLGSSEAVSSVKKRTSSATPTEKSGYRTAQRRVAKPMKSMLVMAQPLPVAAASVATLSTTTLPTDPHVLATPTEEQQAILRARTINPERAFTDWPPAVKL